MIVQALVRLLNRVWPKKTGAVVFISRPDFADNPRALFDWLLKTEDYGKYTITWIITGKEIPLSHNDPRFRDIKFYPKDSFHSFFSFFTAEIIVTSHNQYVTLVNPERQLYVSIGHGIPLKCLGYLHEQEQLSRKVRKQRTAKLELQRKNIGLLVATSPTVKTILSGCFHVPGSKIDITGYPRNDDLFINDTSLLQKGLFPEIMISKLFVFMPTFAETNEARKKSFLYALENEVVERDRLFSFLDQNSCSMIIKLHPREWDLHESLSRTLVHPRIKVLSGEMPSGLSLYQMLAATDCLVTDFSSVAYDFLLLLRPMIFVKNNVLEYSHSRGLTVTPLLDWAPGRPVETLSELITAMYAVVLGEDEHIEERRRTQRILHQYCDAESSARLWAAIMHRRIMN